MTDTKRPNKPTTTITVSTPEGDGAFTADYNILATRMGKRMAELTRAAIDAMYGPALKTISQERIYADAQKIVKGTDLESALAALPTAAFADEVDLEALKKSSDQLAYVRAVIGKVKRNARRN